MAENVNFVSVDELLVIWD